MKNKGITLIALVITIIVLLILAGISISMLSGNNSILSRAGDARDDTVEAQEKEQVELAYVSAAVNNLGGNVTAQNLQDELDISVGTSKTKVTKNANNTLNVLFKDTEHNYNVNNGIVTKADIASIDEQDIIEIESRLILRASGELSYYNENMELTEEKVLATKEQTKETPICDNVKKIINNELFLTNDGKLGSIYFDNGVHYTIEVEDVDEIVDYDIIIKKDYSLMEKNSDGNWVKIADNIKKICKINQLGRYCLTVDNKTTLIKSESNERIDLSNFQSIGLQGNSICYFDNNGDFGIVGLNKKIEGAKVLFGKLNNNLSRYISADFLYMADKNGLIYEVKDGEIETINDNSESALYGRNIVKSGRIDRTVVEGSYSASNVYDYVIDDNGNAFCVRASELNSSGHHDINYEITKLNTGNLEGKRIKRIGTYIDKSNSKDNKWVLETEDGSFYHSNNKKLKDFEPTNTDYSDKFAQSTKEVGMNNNGTIKIHDIFEENDYETLYNSSINNIILETDRQSKISYLLYGDYYTVFERNEDGKWVMYKEYSSINPEPGIVK